VRQAAGWFCGSIWICGRGDDVLMKTVVMKFWYVMKFGVGKFMDLVVWRKVLDTGSMKFA